MDFVKKHWPWFLTFAAGFVTFLDPSVQTFAGQHSQYSTLIITIWSIFLAWSKSPKG